MFYKRQICHAYLPPSVILAAISTPVAESLSTGQGQDAATLMAQRIVFAHDITVSKGTCNITGHYTDTPTKNTQVIRQTSHRTPQRGSSSEVSLPVGVLSHFTHTMAMNLEGDLPPLTSCRHPKGDDCKSW